MQPYEPPHDRSPHRNHSAGDSGTPIYDSLYAEYRRLFRALPGDRSGEEELAFEEFGTVHGTGVGRWDHTWHNNAWHGGSWHTGAVPRRPALPAALPPGPRDGHSYGY